VVWTTTPGSAISFGELITAPMIRSRATALRSAPPGSSRLRSGGVGRPLDSPMSYHQGIPFCAKTTGVCGPSSGPTPSASAVSAFALRVEMTTSCTPKSDGGGDLMTCGSQFGGEVAADGAQAKNADFHHVNSLKFLNLKMKNGDGPDGIMRPNPKTLEGQSFWSQAAHSHSEALWSLYVHRLLRSISIKESFSSSQSA
jgi:hypothetical protein